MSNREHQYAVEDIAVAYAPVPPELLLARPKLTDTELRVWCVFAMHRSFQTAKTHIGASTVGEILGVDRTTVGRAIKGLIDKDHLADLGRERDSDTGRMKPREFAVLVNGQRLKLGVVQERTESESHDADTPHGGDNEPESEGDVHDASHDAVHEASHDASHDAEPHTPPNEYARALNEGERRGTKGNISPRGSDEPTDKELVTELTDRTRQVGFEANGRQKNTWASEISSRRDKGMDLADLRALFAKVAVKASEGYFCSLKQAENGNKSNGYKRQPNGYAELPPQSDYERKPNAPGFARRVSNAEVGIE